MRKGWYEERVDKEGGRMRRGWWGRREDEERVV